MKPFKNAFKKNKIKEESEKTEEAKRIEPLSEEKTKEIDNFLEKKEKEIDQTRGNKKIERRPNFIDSDEGVETMCFVRNIMHKTPDGKRIIFKKGVKLEEDEQDFEYLKQFVKH